MNIPVSQYETGGMQWLACIFFLKLLSVLDEIGFEIIFSVIVEVARFDECICLDTYYNAVRHNIVRRV